MNAKTHNLDDTLAALQARVLTIPNELDALRTQRGSLALQAALDRSKAAALDKLDQGIASLERESDDVQAAITEATLQLGEQKIRGRIDKARDAAKKLPGAEKRLRASYDQVRAAVETLASALANARTAEAEMNALVAEAVPLERGTGDLYARGQRRFNATGEVPRLLQNADGPDAGAVANLLAEHVDSRLARIGALSGERLARMEQELREARTGKPTVTDAAAIAQAWPRGQLVGGGQSFVDVYATR